ncbi:hypothetical protein [Sphingobacterium thalpophilum]|nr:hypothetical protein [Sphingobacterium thalpophilum]
MEKKKWLKFGFLVAFVIVCSYLLLNTDNFFGDFFRGIIDGFNAED